MTAPACVQPRHATIDRRVALGHVQRPAIEPASAELQGRSASRTRANPRANPRSVSHLGYLRHGRCPRCDTVPEVRHPAVNLWGRKAFFTF
jgi:hypothetical protein